MGDCITASRILISTESNCIVTFTSRLHLLATNPSTQWTDFKADMEDLNMTDRSYVYGSVHLFQMAINPQTPHPTSAGQ